MAASGARAAERDSAARRRGRSVRAQQPAFEGKNLTFEYRWSETVFDRLPALAAELVSRRCSVIAGNGAGLALTAATTTIPCPCRTWKVCDCHGDHRVRTSACTPGQNSKLAGPLVRSPSRLTRLDYGELFGCPCLYGPEILTDPRLDSRLSIRMAIARLFCRRRALGGHGTRGYGLRRYCWCAAYHGALYDSAGVTRLRATRHVASARRRTRYRHWSDLRADRRRRRNPGYCGL